MCLLPKRRCPGSRRTPLPTCATWARPRLERLSIADLTELHRLLVHKHGSALGELPDDKGGIIKAILALKVQIGILTASEAAAVEATLPSSSSGAPEVATAAPARQAYEEEPSVEERAALRELKEEAMHAPHDEVAAAVKGVVRSAMEGVTQSVIKAAERGEEEEEDALNNAKEEFGKALCQGRGHRSRGARRRGGRPTARATNAFVQLAAAAAPPEGSVRRGGAGAGAGAGGQAQDPHLLLQRAQVAPRKRQQELPPVLRHAGHNRIRRHAQGRGAHAKVAHARGDHGGIRRDPAAGGAPARSTCSRSAWSTLPRCCRSRPPPAWSGQRCRARSRARTARRWAPGPSATSALSRARSRSRTGTRSRRRGPRSSTTRRCRWCCTTRAFADPVDRDFVCHQRAHAAVAARRRAQQPDKRPAAQLLGARHLW